MSRPLIVWAITAALLLPPSAAPAQPLPTYRITVIDGVPPNAENVWAEAINDAGVVAVQAWVPKADKPKQIRWEAFRWTAPGRIERMPDGREGPYTTSVAGIDGIGRIFATAYKFGFPSGRGVIWNGAGGVSAVVPKSADVQTVVYAINALGDAVGTLWDPASGTGGRAMVWPRKGDAVDISALSDLSLAPFAINRHGQVVGSGTGVGIDPRAYLWSADQGFALLGLLPGSTSSGWTSARSINDGGSVAGIGELQWGSGQLLFRWTAAAGFETIALPAGYGAETPVKLNRRGWLVGNSSLAGSPSRPFLWTPEHGLRFIDELIDPADPLRASVAISELWDVNAGGTLVGKGVRDGKPVAVLLTPLDAAR